ncbi:aldose 1-epimerase [Chitinophagaceae bacterium LWZ2-11]
MSFNIKVEHTQAASAILLTGPGCEVEIYAFGALLNSFTVDTAQGKKNIVDGFSSVEDAMTTMTPAFKSALLSPFTCRMNKGDYAFEGDDYHVNKFYLPPHAIHGLIYDAMHEIIDEFADDDHARVTLAYKYNKQDAGYPFSYLLTHTWRLEKGNKLSVTSTVTHDNKQAIPYAQGWHPYFTLGGNVDTYSLQFDSNTMLEFDETLIPTGKKLPYDLFEQANTLNNVFLDNCFELKNTQGAKCVLKNETLQLSIIPDKSYPYLQIYTPPHRSSIAIENLSGAPDCFNNGMGLLKIEPDKEVSFTTTYIVSVLN